MAVLETQPPTDLWTDETLTSIPRSGHDGSIFTLSTIMFPANVTLSLFMFSPEIFTPLPMLVYYTEGIAGFQLYRLQ